jgi:hypothetical protein
MADRNPASHEQNAWPVDTLPAESNKRDGLKTDTEAHQNIDLMAIPPNKPRPIEVTPTRHLFGNFSD